MSDTEQIIDPHHFREVCGLYATGVAVVTTVDGAGAPFGITINSFTSVSLEPPLVQYCLDREASAFEIFETTDQFAINVLTREQIPLSAQFADHEKGFHGVEYDGSVSGCPILSGCLAQIECARYATFDGGDHVIILGRVRRMSRSRAGEPLLFYRGGYGGFV